MRERKDDLQNLIEQYPNLGNSSLLRNLLNDYTRVRK